MATNNETNYEAENDTKHWDNQQDVSDYREFILRHSLIMHIHSAASQARAAEQRNAVKQTGKVAHLYTVGESISIEAPYEPAFIKELKAIGGGKWNPQSKRWSFLVSRKAEVEEVVYSYFARPNGSNEPENLEHFFNHITFAE